MTNKIKKKLIAKVLLASMTIFHTILSAGFCIGCGYLGAKIANSLEISEWWVIVPAILLAISLLSYFETFDWHEKYYKVPRSLLKHWADLDQND
tara:strand:+ start:133 stop:414 length:282 start_codon:yes stop_codon:yes gene_type:complete